MSPTASAWPAPTSSRHFLTIRTKGPGLAGLAARLGRLSVASSDAICKKMMKVRSASRLPPRGYRPPAGRLIRVGELRCAFVATSRARQVRDRLPEGRWRPSIYWPPYWQSLKTASDAVCCLVPSRKSSDVGSSKLSRVARLFNNSLAFGESFSSKAATWP